MTHKHKELNDMKSTNVTLRSRIISAIDPFIEKTVLPFIEKIIIKLSDCCCWIAKSRLFPLNVVVSCGLYTIALLVIKLNRKISDIGNIIPFSFDRSKMCMPMTDHDSIIVMCKGIFKGTLSYQVVLLGDQIKIVLFIPWLSDRGIMLNEGIIIDQITKIQFFRVESTMINNDDVRRVVKQQLDCKIVLWYGRANHTIYLINVTDVTIKQIADFFSRFRRDTNKYLNADIVELHY